MSLMTTEQRNSHSRNIDQLSSAQIVELMNAEDARIAAAVKQESAAIAVAIDCITESFQAGGRLFYIGAGTSGRLGVLDASECPPTFNTPPEMVVGIIAGGPRALTHAIEGAEDDDQQAAEDLKIHAFTARDILVGIATSGRTPYVLGGLKYARKLGAKTIGFTCNSSSEIASLSDISIAPVVGPEVVSGSTRLKSGTATKMVLNMLTTGAMVRIGKTYGNLMVDLRASNAKLRERSIRIVSEITGLPTEDAEKQLARCNGEVKTSIVAQLRGVDAQTARQFIDSASGKLRDALHSSTTAETTPDETSNHD